MASFIKYLFLFAILTVGAGLLFYWYGTSVPAGSGASKNFIVESGESVKSISSNLEEDGLVRSGRLFEIYIWKNDIQKKLQAGSYELSPLMTIREIAGLMVAGETKSREREIKMIEGWRIKDMDRYLADEGVVSAGEFEFLASKPIGEWDFPFEKPAFLSGVPREASLEGYLFPDTYRIFEDASAADIIKKMLSNFEKQITPEIFGQMASQNKNLHDTVIMASILEKEVSGADAPVVSGILYKRMEIGMRLEVDATINYLTGKNNPSSELSDLDIDSPYNTYKYYGLPPGPISNPGLNSIKAALNPSESEYLFYLNRQDTKETVFSRTFEEHVANKNKYLK